MALYAYVEHKKATHIFNSMLGDTLLKTNSIRNYALDTIADIS